MPKDNDFSVHDLEKIILAGEKKVKGVKKPIVADEVEDEYEDETEEIDVEKIFEEALEQIILESDFLDINRVSTFAEAGIMSNNKGLVVEVQGIEDLNTGKYYDGPFEFQLTITHRGGLTSETRVNDDSTDFDVSEVDESSVIVDNIDMLDYPDFSDAFIRYAEFKDGTPLTDEQLDELNKDSDFVHKMVLKRVH